MDPGLRPRINDGVTLAATLGSSYLRSLRQRGPDAAQTRYLRREYDDAVIALMDKGMQADAVKIDRAVMRRAEMIRQPAAAPPARGSFWRRLWRAMGGT